MMQKAGTKNKPQKIVSRKMKFVEFLLKICAAFYCFLLEQFDIFILLYFYYFYIFSDFHFCSGGAKNSHTF